MCSHSNLNLSALLAKQIVVCTRSQRDCTAMPPGVAIHDALTIPVLTPGQERHACLVIGSTGLVRSIPGQPASVVTRAFSPQIDWPTCHPPPPMPVPHSAVSTRVDRSSTAKTLWPRRRACTPPRPLLGEEARTNACLVPSRRRPWPIAGASMRCRGRAECLEGCPADPARWISKARRAKPRGDCTVMR